MFATLDSGFCDFWSQVSLELLADELRIGIHTKDKDLSQAILA